MFSQVFCQKAQYEVPIFLEKCVLAPIAPISLGVGQMLCPV